MAFRSSDHFIAALFSDTGPFEHGEMHADTLGANTVTEFRFGVFADVKLHLLPGALIVLNFFTIGTDLNQSAQNLDLMQRLL